MSARTNKHYSQELAVFEGFLDPYMKYSSGWFEQWDEPLDAAIVRMLDIILEAGRVRDGTRVLDIGNGWGAVLKRLREKHSGIRYLGVNPSQVQLEYIADAVDADATCIQGTFEDVMGVIEGPFDTILMIGAICHMRDKLAVKKRANELLAPGGRLVIEDTFFLSEDLYQAHARRDETRFVQDDVFGFAHVHSLAHHFDDLRRAGFRVMSALNNSDHYAHTIEIWTARLKEYNPKSFPMAEKFVQYMDVFQRGWGYTISNYLMACEKLPERRRQKVAFPGR